MAVARATAPNARIVRDSLIIEAPVRLLLECRAHTREPFGLDDDLLFLLLELRIAERDLVRADGNREIGERGLTRSRAVDQHVGPRNGVDADPSIRQCDRDA